MRTLGRRKRCLDPQLLVQRGLEAQDRVLVVQTSAIDQEDVFGALAERVDLRAHDVDIRLCQHVCDPREQSRSVARDDLIPAFIGVGYLVSYRLATAEANAEARRDRDRDRESR